MKSFKTFGLCCALIFSTCLSGCAYFNQPQNNIQVADVAIDPVAIQTANLIRNQIAADNTLSILKTENKEIKELYLCDQVAEELKKHGYAVQTVSDASERQKGDVSEMSAQGIKIILHLTPLEQSSYYRVSVDLRGVFYFRMYAYDKQQFIPVSPWSKANSI